MIDFNKLRRKIYDKLDDFYEYKVFRTEEDRVGFLKISRWICVVFWVLCLVKLLDGKDVTIPLLVFTVLIILITIFIPENERIP
jgi:hypothetical protein